MLIRRHLQALLVALLSFFHGASLIKAEVKVSDRHFYVLYPGIDAVWGSYLVLVSNNGQQDAVSRFPVLLPRETVDFQGQENLAPDELKLGADGGLTVEKSFPPGEHMLNIGFKLPASKGISELSFRPSLDFDTLGLFVWQDSMQLEGQDIEVKKGVPFSGRYYDAYTRRDGTAGQEYRFTLTGIPEGRGRLWLIGWSAGAILLIVGLALAYFSRPKRFDGEIAL